MIRTALAVVGALALLYLAGSLVLGWLFSRPDVAEVSTLPGPGSLSAIEYTVMAGGAAGSCVRRVALAPAGFVPSPDRQFDDVFESRCERMLSISWASGQVLELRVQGPPSWLWIRELHDGVSVRVKS